MEKLSIFDNLVLLPVYITVGVSSFLLLRHYVRRIVEEWSSHLASSTGVDDRRAPAGLSEAELSAIPTFPYAAAADGGEAECAICIGALKKGKPVKRLPRCGHLFHERCISTWLVHNPSCPLCRREARRSSEQAATTVIIQVRGEY